jgi:hypothetical protein
LLLVPDVVRPVTVPSSALIQTTVLWIEPLWLCVEITA